MRWQTAHIALGSNLGDRQAVLRQALALLERAPGVRVVAVSAFLETDPAGGPPGQGRFLNAAAEIQTCLSPPELLAVLHEVESACGRDRAAEVRHGPRSCDLDLLLMGQRVLRSEDLAIPHPRMHERLFVLRPLAQIAPHARHPVLGRSVAELLAALESRP